MNIKTRLFAVAAALAILLAAGMPAAQPLTGARASAQTALRDLQSVDELKALFNHDAGRVRIVLLLSPT